ncbi:sugar phosphate isomerase/epimerase family protein [Sagittula salina]|uniref:Sugar phosphate isomerase/epimerase n=1 Tax=Sagittula salina TaxID=2820268 RepID=A0A940MNG1_9RHOB|nr:sugar phosphate isomerase/epimerase [Sagittula salina]MBP0482514.1 sugar phosphate isomerase/epimerase [Sagittula salina]
MKPGLISNSLAHLSLGDMLDNAARLGLHAVELVVGGTGPVPHVDRQNLLDDPRSRADLLRSLATRGLTLVALNAMGNPLHPQERHQGDDLVDAIRLAGLLGVETVITASGLPAGNPSDTTPNWITNSWTVERQRILRYQWEDVLLPFWTGISALARENGVREVSLTLGANQSVHNVPTLLQLREAVGPTIGANLDTSQQFLMGADPIRVAAALGDTLQHVHAKDVLLNPPVRDVGSIIDTGDLADMDERAWSFVTPGYGHDRGWWARFFYQLALQGYDGPMVVDHQDLVLAPLDALRKSAALLRHHLPAGPQADVTTQAHAAPGL